MEQNYQFKPLKPAGWPDLVQLFGENGADGGCWCMYWRLTRREFSVNGNGGNRRAMREIVKAGKVPGILAYKDAEPIGWCSVAPRVEFGSLERSPVLKRLDELPVWSIVCLFVADTHRQQGLALALIKAALGYIVENGGQVAEAYPSIIPEGIQYPGSLYMGTPSLFEKAGFVKESQPSDRKVIMRWYLDRASHT